MPQSTTGLSIQKSCLYHIQQQYNKKLQYDKYHAAPLSGKLTRVVNTFEDKVTNDTRGDARPRMNILRSLMCWNVLITGTKQCCSQASNIDHEKDYYSIHKNIYRTLNTETKIRESISTLMAKEFDDIIPEQTDPIKNILVTPSPTRAPAIEKNEYIHDNQRNIYFDTVVRNKFFPLGIEIYSSMDQFCDSGLKQAVGNAFNSDLNTRYQLLCDITNQIGEYKDHINALKIENIHKDTLSPDEHFEEIIARKKLTILYLAADAIIKNNSENYFRMIAMGDIKNHSDEALMKKENNIMLYIHKHKVLKEY